MTTAAAFSGVSKMSVYSLDLTSKNIPIDITASPTTCNSIELVSNEEKNSRETTNKKQSKVTYKKKYIENKKTTFHTTISTSTSHG